ncbi:hypothetical protein C5L38_35005 (plasmid) [Streptomyces sp. WAC00288]|uniref:hypothetical protein n=1 Tax=unclassified Streptomyces TaxID=2593676 RepID=UPI0007872789|nr:MULTISPECIES: hypothetical protein [unclassified Streptomyces]AVH93718.1 hypothetical protein C5L38_00300 [Streptomyces sp. WAC00288]AVI00256.1 hypothetical protein C5L38_35005 [Streptomyces sp. WAC00288]KYG51853.1 hypothetical protein AWI43_31370 [Streptomyces sp. WAC04657]
MVYGVREGWRREGFESHEGMVGVLLADGSEPGPVFFDLGSGATFHESSDWWHYNGTFRRPTAVTMRGRCACGWRGAKRYPIDWETVRENNDPDAYDTSGPYTEWETHLDDVAERAVTLPEDLATLLGQVRERLDRMWLEDDTARGYTAMLKACGELEAIVAETGPEAARALAREHDEAMPAIAEALGTTEQAARARLLHYEHLTWH